MQARIKALNGAVRLSVTGLLGTTLAAAMLLAPSQLLALGLGDIMLESDLNEPLRARIELIDLGTVAPEDIQIDVGSQQEFERAGLTQTGLVSTLQFTVEPGQGNDASVLVTSSDNVTEPFLNFVVAARWPNGGLIKEYTLLMDLPGNDSAAQTSTADATNVSQAAAVQPATQQPAAPAEAQAEEGEILVNRGDTLWDLAQRTRPDASVSVQQMMVALQDANPDAFVNNDINRLLTGRVLRVPSEEDVRLVDPVTALSRVSGQAALPGQPLTAGSAGNAAGGQRDELTILSGDQELAGGSSDLEATISMLESELMLSEENLDRARLENRELTERLAMLEEQIDILQNIIAIEDERLAQLQDELSQQAEATALALNDARAAAAELEAMNNEEQGLAGSLMGMLQGNLLKLVVALGGLLVVVLGLLAVVNTRRRRAMAEAEDMEFEARMDADDGIPVVTSVEPADMAPAPMAVDVADDEVSSLDLAAAGSSLTLVDRIKALFQRKKPELEAELEGEQPIRQNADLDDDAHAYDSAEPIADISTEPAADDDEPSMLASRFRGADDDVAPTMEDDLAAELRSLDAALEAVDEEELADTDDEDLSDLASSLMAEAPPEAEEEAVEFVTTEQPESVDVVADPVVEVADAVDELAADAEEGDEVFEFALSPEPEVEVQPLEPAPAPDVETFSFRLDTPVEPVTDPDPVDQQDDVEVVSFVPSSTPAGQGTGAAEQPSIEMDDMDDDAIDLDLANLSFDDTMEPEEEELVYQPRTGDECDTKLDLAVAYEAMGDLDGALEILDEVLADGNADQREEAGRLKEKWQA